MLVPNGIPVLLTLRMVWAKDDDNVKQRKNKMILDARAFISFRNRLKANYQEIRPMKDIFYDCHFFKKVLRRDISSHE